MQHAGGRQPLRAHDLAALVAGRARLSDVVARLAQCSAEEMAAAGHVRVCGAGRREAQMVRLLRHRYPALRITATSAPAESGAACSDGLCADWPAARHSQEMRGLCEAATSLAATGGLKAEGIFRLMRSIPQTERLADMLVSGSAASHTWAAEDPHVVAGAIKAYARRRMAQTFRTLDEVLRVSRGDTGAYLSALGAERRAHVSFLRSLAAAASQHADTSLMGVDNLARVFAPNLFHADDALVELQNIGATIAATAVVMTLPADPMAAE